MRFAVVAGANSLCGASILGRAEQAGERGDEKGLAEEKTSHIKHVGDCLGAAQNSRRAIAAIRAELPLCMGRCLQKAAARRCVGGAPVDARPKAPQGRAPP